MVLFTLLTSLFLQRAFAVVLLYEPFPTAYTNGGNLGAGSTGSQGTWTAGASAGAGLTISNTAALSYTGLSTSNGSRGLIMSSTGTARNRGAPFAAQSLSAGNPTVYFSFLLNVQTPPSVGTRSLVYLRSDTSSGTPHLGVWINSSSQLLIGKNTTSPSVATPSGLIAGTHLVVVRWQFVSGSANDLCELWVDPGSLGANEVGVPASTISVTSGTDQTTLSSIILSCPGNSTGGTNWFDELRVGTIWADVTPSGVCLDPSISTDPTNQIVNAGSSASFSVTADGSSPNYQWQISGNSGSTWTNVSTGNGGNSAGYTTPTMTAADSGSQYRCIVGVSCNSVTVTSQVATATVICDGANIIQGPPPNLTSYIDSTAAFFITASGTSRSYQWEVSTDNGGSWNSVSTGTGGTTSNYITATLTLAENQTQYRCLVSVPCNNSSQTSSVTTLTIIDPATLSFRSATNGNWNNYATWEQSTNGTAWLPATALPYSGNSSITVRTGHTVTVIAPVTVDDLVVESGGKIAVNGGALTIADSATTTNDVDVAGTLEIDSNDPLIIIPAAQLRFNGGTYRWNSPTIGNIPTALWDVGSTCEIANGFFSGTTGTPPVGLNQDFYHFYWNWPGCQRCNLNNQLTSIRGNLRVNGAANFDFSVRFNASGTCNLTVGGDVILESGYTTLSGGSVANTILNWFVGGNFTISNGAALDSRSSDPTSSANIYFTNTVVAQSFTNAGTIAHTGEGGGCPINWYVNSNCTLNLTGNIVMGTSNGGTRDSVTVEGTLNCRGNQITGAGNLTISPDGTLTGTGTSQIASGLNGVNYGGTLNLPGLPTLHNGDNFLLFGASSYSGSLTIVPPLPGVGLTWNTSTFFTSDGVLRVSGPGGGNLRIDGLSLSGTNLILNGSGGTANGNYDVLSSTNLNLSLSSWPSVGASQFDGTGNFIFTNGMSIGEPLRFYIIQQPP